MLLSACVWLIHQFMPMMTLALLSELSYCDELLLFLICEFLQIKASAEGRNVSVQELRLY